MKLLKTCLAILIGFACTGALLASQQASPKIYGMPTRLRSLADLTPLISADSRLNTNQKTEVLFRWLIEELRVPSKTTKGISGAPIDSNYIKKQLVWSLGLYGEPLAIAWLYDRVNNSSLKDYLAVSLGIMGDSEREEEVMLVLGANSNPSMRDLAALAIVRLGAVEALPALKRAQSDEFFIEYVDWHEGPKLFYPVREAAKGAIHSLQSLSVLREAETRKSSFEAPKRNFGRFQEGNRDWLGKLLRESKKLKR
jgi:hypothetical protein